MSDIDRERQRKEAADSITSRPPGASDSRIEAAMRRYLGASMFQTLRRPKGGAHSGGEPPAERSTEEQP